MFLMLLLSKRVKILGWMEGNVSLVGLHKFCLSHNTDQFSSKC